MQRIYSLILSLLFSRRAFCMNEEQIKIGKEALFFDAENAENDYGHVTYLATASYLGKAGHFISFTHAIVFQVRGTQKLDLVSGLGRGDGCYTLGCQRYENISTILVRNERIFVADVRNIKILLLEPNTTVDQQTFENEHFVGGGAADQAVIGERYRYSQTKFGILRSIALWKGRDIIYAADYSAADFGVRISSVNYRKSIVTYLAENLEMQVGITGNIEIGQILVMTNDADRVYISINQNVVEGRTGNLTRYAFYGAESFDENHFALTDNYNQVYVVWFNTGQVEEFINAADNDESVKRTSSGLVYIDHENIYVISRFNNKSDDRGFIFKTPYSLSPVSQEETTIWQNTVFEALFRAFILVIMIFGVGLLGLRARQIYLVRQFEYNVLKQKRNQNREAATNSAHATIMGHRTEIQSRSMVTSGHTLNW